MKNNLFLLLSLAVAAALIMASCSRYSMHNHGVDNSGFAGYR